MDADTFPRCAAATDLRSACTGVVDDLHDRWPLPSAYLLVDGRLRCMASRGYFQVSDGFTTSTGVIGRVVSTGEAVVLQDTAAEPEFVAAVPGLRAEVCVPVTVFGEVVGAVNLETRDTLPAAAVDDVHRAAVALGRRLEALGGLPPSSLAERLARIAVGLAGQVEVAQVRRRALEGAQQLSGSSTAALAELGEDGWVVAECVGPLTPVLLGWDTGVLDLLAGWVQAKTSSYFPPGEVVPPDYAFLAGDIRALSVQPLVAAGRVTGLLITADAAPGAPDPTSTAAMELLAMQAAAMLAVTSSLEELSRQATRDPLTGLRNRRGLLEHVQQAADAGGWALVLLDLDGFKAVNDRFGHAAGDALLRRVADRLTPPCRTARWSSGWAATSSRCSHRASAARPRRWRSARTSSVRRSTARPATAPAPASACACSTSRRPAARWPTRTRRCTPPSGRAGAARWSGRRTGPGPEPGGAPLRCAGGRGPAPATGDRAGRAAAHTGAVGPRAARGVAHPDRPGRPGPQRRRRA